LLTNNLGITNFQVIGEGWLEKFKKRHLTFKKVCGESASVDPCISLDWEKELTS